ncbi:MAG: hypothetical protein KDC05_15665, partial [Bacteroidales bacterium]|nr:hypothetical protein [Bacteroidales bacterium]
GGSEGVNCYYFIALDEGYTYFLASNTKSFYLSDINKQIRNIIDDKPTEKILKSGFERIALTINTLSEDELMKKVAFIRTHPEEYYLALHEFNELAWKYWIDENYDEAFRIIKLATVAMPDNAGAFEVLAEAYMETGNNDLAIQNYTKTINMLLADPDKKDKKWAKEWIADMQEIIQNINNN